MLLQTFTFFCRKPSCTSSRVSLCWSCPWDTRRRRWQQRWCRNGRRGLARDACRRPRRRRRTRTRRSRGWPKPARPRSKASERGSPSRISVPWFGTATRHRGSLSLSPQGSPLPHQRLLFLHLWLRWTAASAGAPISKSTPVLRLGFLSAAWSVTGRTCSWSRAQLEPDTFGLLKSIRYTDVNALEKWMNFLMWPDFSTWSLFVCLFFFFLTNWIQRYKHLYQNVTKYL